MKEVKGFAEPSDGALPSSTSHIPTFHFSLHDRPAVCFVAPMSLDTQVLLSAWGCSMQITGNVTYPHCTQKPTASQHLLALCIPLHLCPVTTVSCPCPPTPHQDLPSRLPGDLQGQIPPSCSNLWCPCSSGNTRPAHPPGPFPRALAPAGLRLPYN